MPEVFASIRYSKAIYDEHHHLLRLTLSPDDKYRLYTPLINMPPQLINATLLQEDRWFYWHLGINPVALIKASYETYILKSRRMGASTITMQLARIMFGINSKSAFGKMEQMLRAIQLELHYSKKQILEMYLNLAPYGNNIEGVGAASIIYFAKTIHDINLSEALLLSVIPQNPQQRATQKNKLTESRKKLFARWIKYYPQDLNQQAIIDLPIQMKTMRVIPFLAPHFSETILLNAPSAQQEIVTTLNLELQQITERVLKHYLARKKELGVYNAALMLVDVRDMSIKSLIGSADFFNANIQGQINGTQIKRSPGSTLKPFIYALALEQGLIHPHTLLKDVPHRFGHYAPDNFDYDFMGPLAAKDALVLSRNIPAIYLAEQLQQPNLYRFLEAAHIRDLKSEAYYGLALVLGGVELSMHELVSLYAMLLNEGIWQPLRMRAHTQTLGALPQTNAERLLSPEASFLVLDMLEATPGADASYDTLRHQLPIAWKTGTSSGYRDAWTIGTFGPYVLAVWIGNFDNSANHAFVGKTIAAPLFFELIDAIARETNVVPLARNPNQLNLTQIEVCKASGLLPTRYCPRTELTWFIPGKSPIKTDSIYREIAIDKNSKRRTCHIDKNTVFEVYEFWSSDLLKIFKAAGVARRTPPPYDADCGLLNAYGSSPQITSPQMQAHYIIPMHDSRAAQKRQIAFSATADADVVSLHWFINNIYLGKTARDQIYWWNEVPGRYTVRVVDDHGRVDTRELDVRIG